METLENLTSELSLSNSSHPSGRRTAALRTPQLHIPTEPGMNNSHLFSYLSVCPSSLPPAVRRPDAC